MTTGVMAVIQRQQNLHKVAPDSVFGNGTVLLHSLLDDRGEVATTTVFHENV
jgi:hypothetical protein